MLPNFFYHPRILSYDFGPRHPLKPERLNRTIRLLEALGQVEFIDPGPGRREDAERMHSVDYVSAVEHISCGFPVPQGLHLRHGIGTLDNPAFEGMFEASLAYLAATVRAAEAVRDGANLAFSIGGGLHHAQRDRASGFCIFNDPAIAVQILRERFERVAYVDIDVHHGDGVQALWYDDPTVMTCSIHQDGRTLYPGTGHVFETGAAFTSVNVPLMPKTTGDVWVWAFDYGILPALEAFQPEAIVLQLGTDAHALDPLAHLDVSAQEWLHAVRRVRDFGVPIVATGGGGYNLGTVPRMWVAACLALAGLEVPEVLPKHLAEEWQVPKFFDDVLPGPEGSGMDDAKSAVTWLNKNLLPNIPRP